MLFFYEGNSLASGIYEIRNRYTNRSYIGQAKEFKRRWKGHLSSLIKNKHQNKFLLNDFNKCKEELGHNNFFEFHIIEILENSTKEERNIREEYWIKIYKENRYELYNFIEKINGQDRSCFSKTPEATSEKLSKSLKIFYSNPENRIRQSQILKGKSKPKRTEEHSKKLSKSKIGTKHSIKTKQKMSASHKTEKVLNKLKQTYTKYKDYIISKQFSKIHTLIQPDGTIIKIKNLNKFCKERNMHSSGFSNLLRKSNPEATYKGWKYLGSTNEQ